MQSLPSDLLLPVFAQLDPADLGSTLRVNHQWNHIITSEESQTELWAPACERDFGVLKHHLELLRAPLHTWSDVYTFCQRSLWHHRPGVDAAWRAYRHPTDSTKDASPRSASCNKPLLRAFAEAKVDHHCDLLPLRMHRCDDGRGDFHSYYPPARAIQFNERFGIGALMARKHVLLNGTDAVEPTSTMNLRTEKLLPPLEDCWCSSRGNHTNAQLVVKLERPAIVTVIGIINPADGFDNPVRDALAFGAMAEGEIFSAGAGLSELPRTCDGDLALEHPAESVGVLRKLIHRPNAPLSDRRTVPAQEPLALIQFPADGYRGKQNITPCAPTLCQYVRFQLLSSYNPRQHPDWEKNFDVSKLQVFGTPIVLHPEPMDGEAASGTTSRVRTIGGAPVSRPTLVLPGGPADGLR